MKITNDNGDFIYDDILIFDPQNNYAKKPHKALQGLNPKKKFYYNFAMRGGKIFTLWTDLIFFISNFSFGI